jgi:PAS domain S-box-containing protein
MPLKIGPSPEATIGIDERGVVISWNAAAERLLGRSAADALGRPCYELMHGSSPAGLPLCSADCAVIGLCREGKAARRYEMVATRPDGTELWLEVTSVTLDDEGHPVSVHVLTESVSARRLAHVAEAVVGRLTAQQRSNDDTADTSNEAVRRAISQALTAREIEVLRLVAAGVATDEIARRLGLARNTVRNHIQNIESKLGAHSRIEAVVLALRAGLVHLH